jgi:hypothetical protein
MLLLLLMLLPLQLLWRAALLSLCLYGLLCVVERPEGGTLRRRAVPVVMDRCWLLGIEVLVVQMLRGPPRGLCTLEVTGPWLKLLPLGPANTHKAAAESKEMFRTQIRPKCPDGYPVIDYPNACTSFPMNAMSPE